MKISSFNLRTECDKYPNDFPSRAPLIAKEIQQQKPSLIGFQEASNGIWEFLNSELSKEYYVFGIGREQKYNGERCPVAIKKSEFDVLSYETRWLSPTPLVPGSRYEGDQSRCPRIYTLCKLVKKENTEVFYFLNTHLDHVGSSARVLETKQIVKDIANLDAKIIITGDMNAEPNSPEMKLFVENGYFDLTKSLEGTFHDYGKLDVPVKIDYIFSNMQIEQYSCYKSPIQCNENGTYPTDHVPVYVEF